MEIRVPDSYIGFLLFLKVGLDIYRESLGRSPNILKFMQEIHSNNDAVNGEEVRVDSYK
ncbi:MAG: hypothetical protein QXI38_03585 [Conexivisphaerales archaeon]